MTTVTISEPVTTERRQPGGARYTVTEWTTDAYLLKRVEFDDDTYCAGIPTAVGFPEIVDVSRPKDAPVIRVSTQGEADVTPGEAAEYGERLTIAAATADAFTSILAEN